MAKAMRKCRVCGKEYPYCKTWTSDKFRWQDVACSPECGAIYFARIEASRSNDGAKLVANDVPVEKAVNKDEPVVTLSEEPTVDEKIEADSPKVSKKKSKKSHRFIKTDEADA